METLIRRVSGSLTLTEVVYEVKYGKRQRCVKLLCKCSRSLTIPLSRWVHQPPAACQACTIERLKKSGYHGFSPRYRQVR